MRTISILFLNPQQQIDYLVASAVGGSVGRGSVVPLVSVLCSTRKAICARETPEASTVIFACPYTQS